MLAELGLKHPDAAKLLHVSLRTLQNWLSGTHQVPYAVYKLLRLIRYTELPGQAWQGWHFSRGQLVTPEGRTIDGSESAWWSLLVRQAHGFGQLYQENLQLKASASSFAGRVNAKNQGVMAGAASEASCAGHGLVSSKTSNSPTSDAAPHNGAIMGPWHITLDFPSSWTLSPVSAASTSASALTPSSASPLTPISGLPPCPPYPLKVLQAQSFPARPGLSLTALPELQSGPLTPCRLHLASSADKKDGNLRPDKGRTARLRPHQGGAA